MNDRRNVIVMFLLIMLSFAIITEVSAASEAEINGTGSNHSMMPDGILIHDIACERLNENQMQDHFDVDDFQSHDGQKSFEKTPEEFGDNISNENLYEHNMDLKPDLKDLNQFPEFKPSDNMSRGMFDGFKPQDNVSDDMFDKKPLNLKNNTEFKLDEKPMGEFNSSNLRNNSFTNHFNNELIDDVVSNLIGLSNVAHNFKKDDMNVSPKKMSNQKPMGDAINESAPVIHDVKNSSDIGSFDINKNTKTQKIVKKEKIAQKSNKKVKSIKKPKKVNKKSLKKSKKERAKL